MVSAAAYEPEIKLEGYSRSKTGSIASATGGTFASCMSGIADGGCSGSFCGAAFVLITGVCIITSGVRGIVEGSKTPASADIRTSETNLFSAIQVKTIQHSLQQAINDFAMKQGNKIPSLEQTLTDFMAEQHDYKALANQGIDTVMEVGLSKIGTTGSGLNAPIQLYMNAQVRLIRTRDNSEIATQEFIYEGESLALGSWSDNQAIHFTRALQAGYNSLGQHIYEQMFMLYPFPDRSPHGAGLLAAAFGLAPISPPTRGQLTGDTILDQVFDWKEVASRRPTLSWERFPRSGDMAKDPKLSRATQVSYDLMLARERNLVPADIIYQKQGLKQNSHTLDIALAANSRFFWTVRARFELDGELYLTEWGVVHYMALGRLTAPSKWSYRFKTP